ncbi:hypothetical protein [Marinilabilia rubra]|uniref:Glycoside hydrolase family 42 N-terminal domain-containing protein n=1 Tax=Marinilabilia rubra TaxID=2162893 RepID=A0A2U2BDN0_9BACT|nr:hypothetical protein [Marinilabilia rubra]PWE01137.1 hypothetical protein DDZ16_01210 [Marinilabilia rubra]
MKKYYFSLLLSVLLSVFNMHAQISFKTNDLEIKVNKNGQITHLISIDSGQNFVPEEKGFLLKIKMNGKVVEPERVEKEENDLLVSFPEGIKLKVKTLENPSHVRFEMVSVNNPDSVEALIWGPIKTLISEIIGDFVGVVRNDEFAIGIQALNVKTTGGQLKNKEGAVYSRGTAAVPQDYGSSLQAFCVNRSQSRKIEVWNGFKETQVVGNPGFGIEGSAIAVFGTKPEKALATIGQIEIKEGLPHILIDGEWIKSSEKAGRPYIISNFSESNFGEMLDFVEEVGFYSLYHSHPFSNWGHFDLLPGLFPGGRDGLKACVEKASQRNIRVGVHTLTNFITTNDPLVTPIPNDGLAIYATTTLVREIAAEDDEIIIEDPEHYSVKTSLQTVRIGDELIRFARVSDTKPYRLLQCQRGAFGTNATDHKAGDTIGRLIDHPYKTFYPDMNLQSKIVENLVDFFNETGVSHLDFDGHEGAFSTGYGDASKDYFALKLIEGVDHPLINGTSRSSHFYWHINTYMNWGEPWYGGMRESQNEVRFRNQAVLERNYQPNMLGWFWYRANTTPEEMEWVMARAAGWNAGYALVVNPDDIKKNPHTSELIEIIRIWEEAKTRNIFNEQQRRLLKSGENDFSLSKVNELQFNLQHYKKETFIHDNIVLQPGQPNYSEWSFISQQDGQPLYIQLGANGEEGVISNIVMELDGFKTMKFGIDLQAGYSCVYNGGNAILVYNEKGQFIKKVLPDFEDVKLDKGRHTIRISCDNSNSAMKLKGEIRLKDRVDTIKL